MSPLLYIALWMQLSVSQPVKPGQSSSQSHEQLLLHRALDRGALRTFSVWDRSENKERPIKRAEIFDDSTPVLIVHLWATWCVPCKEEFPLWRELTPRLRNQHNGRVHVVHVALQDEALSMNEFLKEFGKTMPNGPLYIDLNEALLKNLRSLLQGVDPQLPITMWLNPKRVVWKVIVGGVKNRRTEIITATNQLMEVVNREEEAELDALEHPK